MEKPANAAKRKAAPQSYLLNLYPHPGNEKNTVIVGTLEKLGNEGKHAFHDIQELLHLLGIDDFNSGGQDNGKTI